MAMRLRTVGVEMAHSPPITLPNSAGTYAASAWVYVNKGAAQLGIELPGGRTLGSSLVYTTDRWVQLCANTGALPPRSVVRLFVDDYHVPSEIWLDMVSLSPGSCPQ
jgi:hypothetical protein